MTVSDAESMMVAVRFRAWICSSLIAGIAGSNTADNMGVPPADHFVRGALPCVCV